MKSRGDGAMIGGASTPRPLLHEAVGTFCWIKVGKAVCDGEGLTQRQKGAEPSAPLAVPPHRRYHDAWVYFYFTVL